MIEDAGQLAQELTPYVAAAVGVFGTAVLARAGESTSDATVSFGRRVLYRLTGRAEPAQPDEGAEEEAADGGGADPERAALVRTVDDLARAPGDPLALAMVQGHIRRLLADDPALAAELAGWARPAAPAPVVVTASGERSVAIHTNHGTVSTGDTAPGPRP